MSSPEPTHLPEAVEDKPPNPARSRRLDEARAFAGLLVSDIRLYHEEEIYQGRLGRDLRVRLEAPIAAARERFQRRFQEAEEERIFDEEMIRTLAGGDSTVLR